MRIRYLRHAAEQRSREAAVLLVHGLLGYSFSWRHNLNALAQHAAIYAPDLPGVGLSERSRQLDCTMGGLARVLLRFMDAAGIGTADLLGTSHGGAVTMMLAAAAPERIRRMVLVAPVNPWSRHGTLLLRLLAGTAGPALVRSIFAVGELAPRTLLARLYGDPRRIRPGTVEAYAEAAAVPGTREHLLRVVRCWSGDLRELESVLPRIAHIPTLLVWGERDTAVRLESAEQLRRRFASAELVVMRGTGHMPYEEAPDEFNAIVQRFLK
ncbi:MAG: alpha/beta fold hydrolase [Terriglobales bacterium]